MGVQRQQPMQVNHAIVSGEMLAVMFINSLYRIAYSADSVTKPVRKPGRRKI